MPLRLDIPGDVAWLNPMGWMPRFARHRMISASRDLIEWYTRSRLGDVPNVEILDGLKVGGLMPTADGRGVGGVRPRRARQDGDWSVLRADLVVDATGRRSQVRRVARAARVRAAGRRRASTPELRTPRGRIAGATPVRSSTMSGGRGIFVQARPAEGAGWV